MQYNKSNQTNQMQLVEFLQTSFQNVRSSKRTDDLHDVLLSAILAKNPQWKGMNWRWGQGCFEGVELRET